MKNMLLIISVLLNILFFGYVVFKWYTNKNAKVFFDYKHYSSENDGIKKLNSDNRQVVFIGNSITANWVHLNPDFFYSNGFLCRGIGGNTSPQMLLRFRQDVIELNPKIVVINAGINDIAESDGFYDPILTLNNIKSMTEIAKANHIQPILTSVLPCKQFDIRFKIIDNVLLKIDDLNSLIKKYALSDSIYYVDYHTSLKDSNEAFDPNFTFDGLHPNKKGYLIMEGLIYPTIDSILQTKR